MTYENASLVIDGLVECGMVHPSSGYYLKQLLNTHGTHKALEQIDYFREINRMFVNKAPHPRNDPEGYEIWTKREGTI